MTMSINSLMRNEGAPVYYTQAWLRLLESHMAYLRSHPSTTVQAIDPHDAYKYEGDLAGLLQQYGVAPEYHFVVMRMNDMLSPTDFSQDRLSLLVPSRSEIELLRQVFQTTYKKIN